jgi:hypothetical protein
MYIIKLVLKKFKKFKGLKVYSWLVIRKFV